MRACNAAHASEQLVGRVRLYDVIVGSDEQPGYAVIRLRPLPGKEQDGDGLAMFELQRAADLVAGENRKRDLENRHGRLALTR